MEALNVKQKIAAAKKSNETRLQRMTCRNDHLNKLRDETKARIIDELKSSSQIYKDTVKQLIVQGMIRLLEDNVEIKVRQGE